MRKHKSLHDVNISNCFSCLTDLANKLNQLSVAIAKTTDDYRKATNQLQQAIYICYHSKSKRRI